MEEQIIDGIRIITILAVLLYASYTDIQTRKVPNWVWATPMIIAGLLISYEAYTYDHIEILVSVFISVLFTGGLAYILFKFRIFYGADYKAFVVIALLVPTTPEVLTIPIYDITEFASISEVVDSRSTRSALLAINRYIAIKSFGFTVFVNASLFSVVFFFINAYRNIRDGNFSIYRPLRSISAQKISADKISDKHVQYIGQSNSTNPLIRGFQFIRNGLGGVSSEFYRDYMTWYRNKKFNSPDATLDDIEEFDMESFAEENEDWVIEDYENDKKKAEEVLQNDEIWVTASIPFIIPITLGVIFGLIFGNICYMVLGII